VANEINTTSQDSQSVFDRLYFLEHFYLKHKFKIFGLIGLIIAGIIAFFVVSYLEEQKVIAVNEAYFDYQQGINKKENLKVISESNPKLYKLIQLSETLDQIEELESAKDNAELIAKLDKFSKDQDWLISDIATYSEASIKEDYKALNDYSYRESSLLKDFAVLTEAYGLIKENKIQEAHNRLSFVEADSKLKNIADYLMHYGITSN